jgi:hypothetical protein
MTYYPYAIQLFMWNTCSHLSACSPSSYLFLKLAIGLFFTILFLQSGWDKVGDWNGNRTWLQTHFQQTFFRNATPFLLGVLTLLELMAGTCCLAGSVVLLFKGCSFWLYTGILFSIVSLLSLFLGQRLAKDYAGAGSLVAYFIVALIGLYLLSGSSCGF